MLVSQLIQPEGLERGVLTMKRREKAILTIKPIFGYGIEGDDALGMATSDEQI